MRIAAKVREADDRALIEVPRNEALVFAQESTDLFPEALFTGANAGLSSESSPPSFSLVATVKNEADSVAGWVEALLSQDLLPTEVVICDGGSKDATMALLRGSLEGVVPLKLFEIPGANIAEGRNAAIKEATQGVIVCTDLGCSAEPLWLSRLLDPFIFHPALEFCSGFYNVDSGDGGFAREIKKLIVPQLERIEPQTFIPSARSMAFRRELWERVGGFPEELTFAGEDSLFGYNCKREAEKVAFVPDARVRWQMPRGFLKVAKMIFRYARGDAEGKTLFWAHYLWLVRTSLKALFELVLGVAITLFLQPMIGLIIACFGLYRLVNILRRYLGLRSAWQIVSSSPQKIGAAAYVATFQAAGFLTGWLYTLPPLQRLFAHKNTSRDS